MNRDPVIKQYPMDGNDDAVEKHPGKKKGTGMKRLAWMLKRMDYLFAFQQFGKAKEILMRADIALAKLDRDTPHS